MKVFSLPCTVVGVGWLQSWVIRVPSTRTPDLGKTDTPKVNYIEDSLYYILLEHSL